MRAKKTVAFFSVLLVLSMLMCSVDASSNVTASFRGGGVTIDLAYPEEAHPAESIWHNVTLTSTAATTLRNFTVVIKAAVDSGWVDVLDSQDTFSKPLPLTYNLSLSLPQGANGSLQCFIFVNTSSIDDLSTTLYTTLVSDPTFSEMRVLYDEMLANYTSLQEDYETLFNDYNELLANYSSLFANYTTLLDEYDQIVADYGTLLDDYDNLSANYSSLNATYTALLSEHNQLTADYNSQVTDYNSLDADYKSKTSELESLQTYYDDLNSTHNSLQKDYGELQDDYIMLNQTFNNLQNELAVLQERLTDSEGVVNSDRIVMLIFLIALAVLIVFIVYIKRKQEDPYLVIRKETVSMKSDEET